MQQRELRKPSFELTQIIANNLISFRKKHHLSQEKFAEMCDLHRTFISSIERGERNITLSTLELLANVIGIPVYKLLIPADYDE